MVYIIEMSHMHMQTNKKVVKVVQGVMDERGNTINSACDYEMKPVDLQLGHLTPTHTEL